MARFWVLEGIDGTGKSTQVERLAAALRARGRDVLQVREPGSTELGERLRALLLDPGRGAWDPKAEALLFFAARVELLRELVAPALAAGRDVLCERFTPSTLAYQGTDEDRVRFVLALEDLCVPPELRPHRVVLLDLPPEEALRRARRVGEAAGLEADAMERRGLEFLTRVREGYLRYARERPERTVVLDVRGLDEDQVAARLQELLLGAAAEAEA